MPTIGTATGQGDPEGPDAPMTVQASADSSVLKSEPRRNDGAARRLVLNRRPRSIAYLRFRIEGSPTPITQALLRVFVKKGKGSINARAVFTSGWRESTITFRTAPQRGPSVGSTRSARAGRWATIDISRWISQNGQYTLALTSGAKKVLASSESRRVPELVVTGDPGAADGPRAYAYYYLRWSSRHWHDKLGANFPYEATPLPLPADLDEDGCNARSRYEGNALIDVPQKLYSQDEPGVIESHVRKAAAAGLDGFAVNWRGTGLERQKVGDLSYTRRLRETIRSTNEVNAQGIPFKLWINYRASASPVTLEHMNNDLVFLYRRYGTSPALDHHFSMRPMILWGGSRKYSIEFMQSVSERFRDRFYLMGDENWNTWQDDRGAYLDGDTYYWSSQNPYTNPESHRQLEDLAAAIRASGPNPDGSPKLWFAPFTPGYNSELLSAGSCVPRNGGETMRALFEGNATSDPDGWVLISWNEISENTHVEPLQRWGDTYLTILEELISFF